MPRATIYLAGPISACPDGGAWREEVQSYFGDDYDFRDPLAKYDVPADDLMVVEGVSDPDTPHTVGIEEIVAGDKRLIDESDGLLVGYTDVQSVGTPMEVLYARERGLPVAIWVRDSTEFDALSPWYRVHATAITTAPELGLRHVERQAIGDNLAERGVGADAEEVADGE